MNMLSASLERELRTLYKYNKTSGCKAEPQSCASFKLWPRDYFERLDEKQRLLLLNKLHIREKKSEWIQMGVIYFFMFIASLTDPYN